VLTELERRWYQRADLVVTVNQGLADELLRRYGRKPIAVVHNCVLVSEWAPDRTAGPLRRAIGIDADTPLVLYHGGFTANRGLGVLINAMRQPGLESAHLALLGYGPMEEELRRVAGGSASGGRVHVLPAVPPTELDRYVADADIAAMVNQPVSKNEILSTPNKLFESIAAGVPIVTSDFPMRRAIVLDNEDGPLGAVCDPERPQSVAAAIRELLGLPEGELRAMRARCRTAAVRRWNWSREASTLESAYDDLLTVRVSKRAAESGAARL
jgi:glycosyltransferase involved in cell wall biosynthesis